MASSQFSSNSTPWWRSENLRSAGVNAGLISFVGILVVSQIGGVKNDVIESEDRLNSKITALETRFNEEVDKFERDTKAIDSDVSDLKVASGKLDAKLNLMIKRLN